MSSPARQAARMVIDGIDVVSLVLIAVIVLVGAFVQSAVGIGSGMVGTPLVALIEPRLVPTVMLLVTIQISLGVLVSVHRHVNWRALTWAVPARLPGTLIGVWLVTTVSAAALGVGIAVVVLGGVAAVWRAAVVRHTPAALVSAGVVSGVTGTAAAIDGPPLVVLMAHRPPDEVRATMSVFFVAGSLLSLAGLVWQGAVPDASLLVALVVVPVVVVAVPLGSWASRRLPREAFRHVVLAVCAFSAVVLLVKSLG